MIHVLGGMHTPTSRTVEAAKCGAGVRNAFHRTMFRVFVRQPDQLVRGPASEGPLRGPSLASAGANPVGQRLGTLVQFVGAQGAQTHDRAPTKDASPQGAKNTGGYVCVLAPWPPGAVVHQRRPAILWFCGLVPGCAASARRACNETNPRGSDWVTACTAIQTGVRVGATRSRRFRVSRSRETRNE
jgi:hypothetical protein